MEFFANLSDSVNIRFVGIKHFPIRILLLFLFSLIAISAPAATSLDVEVGWGGAYRYGRWAPIFITTSDDRARNVFIEVEAPHDTIHGVRVRQMVSIGPTPLTFPIYIPMGAETDGLAVTIRDASNGRRLVGWNAEELMMQGTTHLARATDQLIGVSGRKRLDRLLQVQLMKDGTNQVQSIPPARLPANPQGYDSMDLLILDDPDLARLTLDQQTAMIDWVRAGGSLLCWIGSDAVATSGPIIENLPADIGTMETIDLSENTLQRTGLGARFRFLPVRHLTARNGAARISIFNDTAFGYRRSLGFGTITLLPTDPSKFMFSSPDQSHAFWQPIIGKLAIEPDKDHEPTPSYYGGTYNNTTMQQFQKASVATMDSLGTVPGAGSFGFSYVVIVMLGMMLLVGPIDWIVLKRLNAQPWTWITTACWITLITLGAVFIGYAFKSGDLHFRTLQVIDQADGQTVASVDTFGIYSPRTQEYRIKADPAAWWQPLGTDFYSSSRSAMLAIDFHEDGNGVHPLPMVINVWNLQFLTGETIATAPPLLETNLHVETRNGVDHVVGTISNRSDTQVSAIRIRRKDKLAILPFTNVIEPQATMTIDEALSKKLYVEPSPGDPPISQVNRYSREETVAISAQYNLAAGRSDRIDEILSARDDLACIYAYSAQCPSPIELDKSGAIEQHVRYIRALVPLNKGGL